MSYQNKPFTTMGIVIDIKSLEGFELAQAIANLTKDKELSTLITIAQETKKRYLIAAGRFNGKGLSGMLCDDELHLKMAFNIANERMDEIGSYSTTWFIKPRSCGEVLGVSGLSPSMQDDRINVNKLQIKEGY